MLSGRSPQTAEFMNEAKIATLATETSGMSNVYSFIDTLPVEIILHIWSFNTREATELSSQSVPFCLLASWISGRWRDIALNTPELWSHVSVFINQKLAWIETQVERSKTSLLTIDVAFNTNGHREIVHTDPESLNNLRDIMSLLRGHLPRWGALDIAIIGDRWGWDYWNYKNIVVKPLQDVTAPALKRFKVKTCTDTKPLGMFRGGTPSLSVISFNDVPLELYDVKDLTSIALHNTTPMPPKTFAMLLSMCSSLQHLSLSHGCITHPSVEGEDVQTLYIPSLEYLSLTLWDTGYEEPTDNTEDGMPWQAKWNLFHTLSLPNLRTLHIAKASTSLPALTYVLRNNTLGSFHTPYPLLDELHLAEVSAPKDAVRDLIACLPTVTTLRLEDTIPQNMQGCLDALTLDSYVGHPQNLVCPRLHTLVYTSYSDILGDNNGERLIALLEERSAMGYPIPKLCMDRISLSQLARERLEARAELDVFTSD